MRAAALRDLVLVVREHQVVAAAMDVETLSQQRVSHCRAFDVPAGTPPPPGAVPARLIALGGFPQHEIHRVALVGRHLDPRAGDHVIDGPPRQLAIVFAPAVHGEKHVSLGLIGMALLDEYLDHRDHLRDILRRPRHVVGLERDKLAHVLEKPLGRLCRDLADRAAALGGAGVDLVIHVGEIAHIGHVIGAVDMPQQPVEDIEHHDGPRIAQMRPVIDRGPADIHAHIVLI